MLRRSFAFLLLSSVLVFAFLAASFAVRNSDFWLHLASGRLLAEGRYPFGTDPFAFTTENHYWANHAWLFDWFLYVSYIHQGGTFVVVLKALLVTWLALVLLRLCRFSSGLGWPVACTLLAVLAMSPRLALHSTLLSYFLLAKTLWLLQRQGFSSSSPTIGRDKLRSWRQVQQYGPLLLLFVLWVNVDGWFFLGPLLVVLFWLSERLQPARSAGDGLPHTPGWLSLAGLAVCLINPYHLHAFTLPEELMPLPDALRQDVRFASLHTSPWHLSLYYGPLAGVDLARVAYLLLLIVGALSFLLNVRNLAVWRLLVWLLFAGLSAWLVGLIPFFAVVAAPITALNLQSAFSRPRAENKQKARSGWWLGAAYFVLLMSALALIGLAWPGWLQGFQDRGRHVEWTVQPDGSLRRAAERLHLWHLQGKLGNGRGFLFHPSVVHYCAYFCPEEKGFLDYRLSLFRDLAREYEEICKALNSVPSSEGNQPGPGWRSSFRNWNVTHLVLYDPVLPRLFPALMQLADENGEWALLDIDGQAFIVGRRDLVQAPKSRVPHFDADHFALAAVPGHEQAAMLPEAPGQGPKRGPRPNDFLSHFSKPIAPPSWQTEAASVMLAYFEARAPYEMRKRLGWTVGLIGLSAPPWWLWDGLLRLAVHIEQAPPNPLDLGEQSPALPLLAVRAARLALADNPDDALAYLQLGIAYLDLARRTPENAVVGSLRPLAELRHIQIATALENALRRDSNSLHALRVHDELAALYEGRFPPFLNPPFLDAALEHRRALQRLALRIGPLPGEDADAFTRRLKENERNVQDLERFVSDRKNEFVLQTRNLGSQPYRKAELAVRMGLARMALEDILMPSSLALLGGEGTRLQVRLQLMLGQGDLSREQLQSADWKTNKANLGFLFLDMPSNTSPPVYRLPAYEWLLLCQTAAEGDYEQAEDVLRSLILSFGGQRAVRAVHDLQRNLPVLVASELGWRSGPQTWAPRWQTTLERQLETAALANSSIDVARQAELHALAAMLALERGRPQQAKQAFQQTFTLSRQNLVRPSQDPSAALAETYLHLLAQASREEQ